MVTGAAVILPAPLSTQSDTGGHRAGTCYRDLRSSGHVHLELQELESSHFDLTSLRTGVMAGAPCPIEIMKRVVSEMHCPEMVVGYGQTETRRSSPCPESMMMWRSAAPPSAVHFRRPRFG